MCNAITISTTLSFIAQSLCIDWQKEKSSSNVQKNDMTLHAQYHKFIISYHIIIISSHSHNNISYHKQNINVWILNRYMSSDIISLSIYNFKVITEVKQQPCPFFCEWYFLTILFANKYLVWKYTLTLLVVQRVELNACNQWLSLWFE